MRSVIFWVENPQVGNIGLEASSWRELLGTLKDIADTSQGSQMLSENVLQIPLKSDLPSLVKCGEACHSKGRTYRVLFLEDEPEWITVTKDEE